MKSSENNEVLTLSPLARRAARALSHLAAPREAIGVAVSGGSDSMALLTLAAHACATTGASLHAITIDHGLRPEAKDEARFVKRACRALGVPHDTLVWRRAADGPVSQDEARLARHGLLAQWARDRGLRRIALGHTRDDRLETFLMRARQGSGWHGLAGLMPEAASPVWPEGRGLVLIRPLLAFGREELREDLRARNVAWIEDPSNDLARFERVRMRRLIGRMDARAVSRALGVMDRLVAMRAAVAAEAGDLLKQLRIGETPEAAIALTARRDVSAEAWLRFVEALLMAAGGAPRPPRRDALDRLLARLASGDPDLARGVTLAGAKIRIRKGALVIGQAPPRRGMDAPLADWSRARALLMSPSLDALDV